MSKETRSIRHKKALIVSIGLLISIAVDAVLNYVGTIVHLTRLFNWIGFLCFLAVMLLWITILGTREVQKRAQEQQDPI